MSLTAEQLERRMGGLGSSEIGAVAGQNPYASAHSVWLRKVGLAEDEPNHATRLGDKIEPVIAELYSEDTGAVLTPAGTVEGLEPWMLATPDRFANGREKLVEIKLVGARSVWQWTYDADGVPDWYQCQVQWQMHVTGIHACDVAALLGGTEFRIYQLTYEPVMAKALETIGRKFWFEHVLPRKAPPVNGSHHAREMLAKLYPKNRRPPMLATEDANEWAAKLKAAKDTAEGAETAQLEAENHIKALMGDAEAMLGRDWRCTWKATKAGTRQFRFTTRGEGT